MRLLAGAPSSPWSRIAWNTATGSLAQLASLAIGFLTTPIILHNLGDARFGAFAIVASLTTYFGMLDLGIGGSLTRYMTFYAERRMTAEVASVVTFGFVFYLVFGLVLAPVAALVGGPLTHLVGIDASVVARPDRLVLVIFGLFVGSAMAGVCNARLASIHRLDVVAGIGLTASATYALSVVCLTARSPKVETVLSCVALQVCVTLGLGAFCVIRLCGARQLVNPFRIPIRQVRELFGFGIWSQINNVSSVINMEADKAIIGGRLGIGEVAPYHVANRLALLSRALPLQLLGALLPDLTARVSRRSGRDEIAAVYRRGSRMLMLFTLLICGFLGGASHAVLQFWLSRPIAGADAICVALLVSYAVNNATGLGTTILAAEGRPRFETAYATLSAVLNVVITVLLIKPMGLAGVIVGTVVGNVLGSLFFLVLFHRLTGIGWWWSMGSWLWKLIAATVLAATVSHLSLVILAPFGASRALLLFDLVIAGLTYLGVFVALLWTLGVPDAEDKALLASVSARVSGRPA